MARRALTLLSQRLLASSLPSERITTEQAPQIGVTPLADAQQPRSLAAGMLPGGKDQPGGQLPAVGNSTILFESTMFEEYNNFSFDRFMPV